VDALIPLPPGYRLIPGRAEQTIAEHQRVIEAIRQGDAEAARAAAREHIARAGRELATTVDDRQEEAE
jgi:DNA-binding GntR family transcriptional regulator